MKFHNMHTVILSTASALLLQLLFRRSAPVGLIKLNVSGIVLHISTKLDLDAVGPFNKGLC